MLSAINTKFSTTPNTDLSKLDDSGNDGMDGEIINSNGGNDDRTSSPQLTRNEGDTLTYGEKRSYSDHCLMAEYKRNDFVVVTKQYSHKLAPVDRITGVDMNGALFQCQEKQMHNYIDTESDANSQGMLKKPRNIPLSNEDRTDSPPAIEEVLGNDLIVFGSLLLPVKEKSIRTQTGADGNQQNQVSLQERKIPSTNQYDGLYIGQYVTVEQGGVFDHLTCSTKACMSENERSVSDHPPNETQQQQLPSDSQQLTESDDSASKLSQNDGDDSEEEEDDDGSREGTGAELECVVPSQCRICHEDGDKQPLIRACRCRGTICYQHNDCLIRWITLSRQNHCEICHYHYQIRRIGMRHLLNWQAPEIHEIDLYHLLLWFSSLILLTFILAFLGYITLSESVEIVTYRTSHLVVLLYFVYSFLAVFCLALNLSEFYFVVWPLLLRLRTINTDHAVLPYSRECEDIHSSVPTQLPDRNVSERPETTTFHIDAMSVDS